MNCDQVFTILTRGPFPSGDDTDAAVETHLTMCAACRHFADALRPDGSTDAESLVPEESRGLPYYWGLAALPGGEHMSAITATEDRRPAPRRRKPTFFERHEPLAHLSGWQLAIAVILGATLGTLLRLLGYSDGAASRETAPPIAPMSSDYESRRGYHDHIEYRLAEKLGAAPACLERHLEGFHRQDDDDYEEEEEYDDAELPSRYTRNRDLCCTQCHNVTAPRFALRNTTAKIVRSCQICHAENYGW